MSPGLIPDLFEAAGAIFTAIGRAAKIRDEATARRMLARLKTHGRQVDADIIALEAARSIPAPGSKE